MNKNKKIVITISTAFIIFLILLKLFFLISVTEIKEISPPPNTTSKVSEIKEIPGKVIKTTLEINGTKYESEVVGKISVYDFMNKLRNEGKINFIEKNYIGMGKLITQINGISSNGEKSWIYYVNGVEAQVGVSNYKISPGDIVSWKYEKFNY